MFFDFGERLRQTKDGEDLQSASALTNFYMDTLMCNEYQLKSHLCMQEYEQVSRLRVYKRRKMHRECMNHLDEFKACLIGIN